MTELSGGGGALMFETVRLLPSTGDRRVNALGEGSGGGAIVEGAGSGPRGACPLLQDRAPQKGEWYRRRLTCRNQQPATAAAACTFKLNKPNHGRGRTAPGTEQTEAN